MSPYLSDLSSTFQLRISSQSLKWHCNLIDEWQRILDKHHDHDLRMVIYNECFNKEPPLNLGLSPKCLAYVSHLRIEIPYLAQEQECQDMLSNLDTLCSHLGEHLQPGKVHFTIEVSYFNKAPYKEDILGNIGPLSHLPQMASLRVVKKHDAPAAI